LAAAFLLALCYLLILSCDSGGGGSIFGGSSSYKVFDYKLRGTWESNETGEYSGALVIDYNTIKISGYASNPEYEKWPNGTDRRPFKDFIKDVPLEGYSEEGKIFIKNAGVIQEGLAYIYWTEDYNQIEFLQFDFNGRKENLRKQ
jgi:hypothetical protein